MKTEFKSYKNLKYVLTYPDGYTEGKKYPVIIFLHGAGSRGNNIEMVTEHAFYTFINKFDDFGFITAAPQCNANVWFDIFADVIDFAEYIASCDFADDDHIYGMGTSMGAYGIWQLAMSKPELFAAIVPISGGGMYWNAGRLKNVPVWAFHGDCDTVVDKFESIKMVDGVNAGGGDAKLTIFPNCGHNGDQALSDPRVYEWLKSKRRVHSAAECETKFNDQKKYM